MDVEVAKNLLGPIDDFEESLLTTVSFDILCLHQGAG